MAIELGSYVRDVVTDYEGRVVSITHDLGGCKRALVVPGMESDGKMPKGEWIECGRLGVCALYPPLTFPETK